MLRPLGDVADNIAARNASATEPIALDGVPSEVRPLVESMNGLISRLRSAVEAQKRFVADAAHELRTPLAAMQIEVDKLKAAAFEDRSCRVVALAAGVKRASALANQLLELARLDEPAPAQRSALDFSALVLDCVAVCAPLADRKGVDLGASVSHRLQINGVENELRSLLTDLVDNAVRYTPSGGTVDVSLRVDDGQVSTGILDTGPGLPTGSETRVFERFYRGGPHESEGTGLGLPIARRVAERHGFILTVENRHDGVSGVRARLAAPQSPGGSSS